VFCHQQCHYVMIGSIGSRCARVRAAHSENPGGLVAWFVGWLVSEKRRERNGIFSFLYGDRGGCPVFRMTWLNGIALAHSCPLRRNGRLASRFFLPLFFLSRFALLHASFSVTFRSCFARKPLRKWFVFFFCYGSKRSAARFVTMLARML